MPADAADANRRAPIIKSLLLAALPIGAMLFALPAARAQSPTGTAVFNALTRTDYAGNTYSGASAVDFAGASTSNNTTTSFTKGRTLMGQSFTAQDLGANGLGQVGFEVTTVQFYLWNGNAADGGATGVNYNNIRANINFWQGSTGEDELTTTPGAGIFSAPVGSQLVYNFSSSQVASVNGVDGAATLVTINIAQPSNYMYTRYGDATDDVTGINNRNKNFLGISIQLQGDTGSGFSTTNDLSLAIWDKADYRQLTTGKIAMATGNDPTTTHPYGGFYRDYNVPLGDPLHQTFNFSGRDERSLAGTSFNSLALALFGQQITATPEPSTFALAVPFLTTAAGIAWRRTRRKAK